MNKQLTIFSKTIRWLMKATVIAVFAFAIMFVWFSALQMLAV